MENLPVNLPIPALSSLDPAVFQAILAVVFAFIAAVLIGLSRRYLTSSTLQGVWAGFITGIIMLLVIEGALFWGIKSFVFGEKAQILPENIRLVLDGGRRNITQVLGIETERERPTAQSVVSDYSLLSPLDAQLAENSICQPEKSE